MTEKRKIIHVDMDAFYASIEMRDNPKIRNRAVVIAKNPRHTGGTGVVATANYVARRMGIHSAMSAQKAMQLCPDAVFVTPNFKKYRAVSAQIHQIFHEYTDIIEPVAFDEAYLDVTQNKKNIGNPLLIAKMIQQEIFMKTNLTSSTGISYNKFLAKMASDYNKPAGTTLIKEEDVFSFLTPLPIEKFRGVGVKTAKKMHSLKIDVGKDLLKKTELELIADFGKMGALFYQHVRGVDNRVVEWERKQKSLGNERTFGQALKNITEIEDMFNYLARLLVAQLHKKQLHGKTIVIKVRNSNFETVTKRRTLDNFYQNDQEVFVFHALQLFEEIQNEIDVRLLGMTMTNLTSLQYENIELPLWKE
ncbi:DNA polymerase IV [Liquorilactobacillus cacaonum]|uniref:DNA polymerase IV n=1 Tax=Liquorilactobacillus cacaonum DSM 21116 TaxID=1423729 RepID=A0A0R2CF63_9LACO|nr:DNA polymerase IV [Liquorilactobacillus cacaonum]KRM90296.1 DNA polymerase IV [Liquorilactobacillus cacaonum DSM 21116]